MDVIQCERVDDVPGYYREMDTTSPSQLKKNTTACYDLGNGVSTVSKLQQALRGFDIGNCGTNGVCATSELQALTLDLTSELQASTGLLVCKRKNGDDKNDDNDIASPS
eukprot:jgi/Psemu1/38633/gm1.38633_g